MQQGRNILGSAGRIASKRQVRFGANALVMTSAFIAILVFINILAVRNHVRWDLTAEGAFSLSPETIQIIENLQQPVTIIGFFGERNRATQDELDSRLQEYTSRTDLISYRFVDPDVNPVLARDYSITSYGTIVFESGERRQQTTGTDEQALTSALLRVTQETPTTIYFLTGHGERALDGFDQNSFSQAKSILEQDNFIVQPISLVISDTIPLENSVLLVADPQESFQEREQAAIANYLAQGGRLMLLSNPLSPAPLTDLMERIGLQWNDDLIIDQQSELGNPTAPAVVEYPFNPITSDLTSTPTLFPSVRTISQTQDLAPAGVTLTPLLQSSPNSQAITDFSAGEARPSPGDAQGPLTFGYSAEQVITATQTATDTQATNASARMVVIGDVDFASNANINLPGTGNSDFFRNAIGWLAAQDDVFTLPPRPEPVDRSVFLTARQSNLVFLGTTLGLPLLVIIAGVWVWWQHR